MQSSMIPNISFERLFSFQKFAFIETRNSRYILMKKISLLILVLFGAVILIVWMVSDSNQGPAQTEAEVVETSSEAETKDTEKEEETLEMLIADIQEILEKNKVPGAGIAIVSKDKDIWVGGLGMADVENNREADGDTLFRIGSISKMFVSLSMLQLQEQGRIDLQDTLLEHAPEIPFKNRWRETHPIKLVHLLEHTTGFDDLHFNEYALAEPNISLKDAYMFNPRSRESRWKPGTFSSYSNGNPPLAAYVLEKKTGQCFEDYVRKNIFDPLDMPTANYFLTPAVEQLLSKGYQGNGKNQKTVDYWHIIMRPSGSINASAREMSHLVKMFLNRGAFDGKRLLSEASVVRMESPKSTLAAQNGLSAGYGLNNYGNPISGFLWQGHNGGMMGFLADLSYQPELGVGFVVMINKPNRALGLIGKRIASYLVNDIPKPELSEDIPLTERELQSYTGTYRRATSRNQFSFGLERLFFQSVSAKDGPLKLQAIPGESTELVHMGKGVFRDKRWVVPVMIFFEDDDGNEYFQQGPFGAMVKVSPFSAWGQLILAGLVIIMMGSSILLIVVYGIGRVIRQFKDISHWMVRLYPGLAVVSLLLSYLLFLFTVTSNQRLFEYFGQLSAVGLFSYLLDWSFRILALIGLYKIIRAYQQKLEIHRLIKAYLLLVSLASSLYIGYTFQWSSWLPIWIY